MLDDALTLRHVGREPRPGFREDRPNSFGDPVQLPARSGRDGDKDLFGDAVGVCERVRESKRATPGDTVNKPRVDIETST